MPRPKSNRPNRSGDDKGRDRPAEGESTGAERLQKVLAAAGIGSRRDCEELIREGRVEVDRQVVTELGTKVDPLQHEIRVDGQAIRKPKRMYFVVNKPMGVVTTNFDPSGRMRVIDLVPTEERVFPVGRLDRFSEGLIIVTNDGAFANRLTHPRYGVEKTYLVRVAGEPDQTKIAKLKRGIHLSDGFCKIESIKIKGKRGNSTDMIMVLNEGKNREIRRVLARVGHKVLRLKRIAVGPLKLADLPTGSWRRLMPTEVESLLADSYRQEEKARQARRQRWEQRNQAAKTRGPEDDEELLTDDELAADHVAEDEELLTDDDFQGIESLLSDDDDSGDDELLADGEFGDDVPEEFASDDDEDDEDEIDGDDEDDFEIVEISDDDFSPPKRGRQPLGDVLGYEDEEGGDEEDGESFGDAPRRGPKRGRPQRAGGGPRGERGAGARPGRSSGPRAGGGPRSRSGPPRGRRSEAGGAGEREGGFASRRPGTRRKVKGDRSAAGYRGGFGSRAGRSDEGPGRGDREGRGARPAGRKAGGKPGGKRPFARSSGEGPSGRAGGARTGGARAGGGRTGGARPAGAGPAGRGPKRGPSSRGPGGGAGGGRGPTGGRGPAGGRGPGSRGPSGRGPGGRGPGKGGPRKGGPRKGGPRR